MKKIFFSGLILLAGLVSCSDNSYKNLPTVDEDDDLTPMPVVLSLGKPNSSVITKGVGGIENNDGTYNESWNGAKVYVFSFLKDSEEEPADFTSKMEAYNGEKPLNIPNCLIDGSLDESSSLLGKEAIINTIDNTITWTGTGENKTVYFPSAKKAYDFYAYYIDDIKIKPEEIQRTSDKISFSFEIDGTQDLMSAKAAITNKQKENIAVADLPTIESLAFSSYTARRGIQPIIQFAHHLVRLKFNIYSGHQDADNVFVESITVESKHKGDFTVVAKNSADMKLDFTDDYTIFTLKDKGNKDGIEPDKYHTLPFDENKKGFDGDSVVVGESVLVAPDNQYKFKIKLKQLIKDLDGNITGTKYYVTNWDLKIAKEGETFKAGFQYTVRIAIYGLQKTEIQVIPQKWENGGHIDVDEDDVI